MTAWVCVGSLRTSGVTFMMEEERQQADHVVLESFHRQTPNPSFLSSTATS